MTHLPNKNKRWQQTTVGPKLIVVLIFSRQRPKKFNTTNSKKVERHDTSTCATYTTNSYIIGWICCIQNVCVWEAVAKEHVHKLNLTNKITIKIFSQDSFTQI